MNHAFSMEMHECFSDLSGVSKQNNGVTVECFVWTFQFDRLIWNHCVWVSGGCGFGLFENLIVTNLSLDAVEINVETSPNLSLDCPACPNLGLNLL